MGTVSPADLEKCVFADFGNLIEGLELRADGTSFFLCLPDGRVFVQTCLLGRHSAENIALAALLASEMGLTATEIEEGIARISPVPHRLQLIESGGVHILDDSYNSNPEGAAEAVEALLRFSGRKIVVTPGLVETGILDEALGRQLGARLAGLDLVILVGDTQVGAVKAGYLDAGGAEENSSSVLRWTGRRNCFPALCGKGTPSCSSTICPTRGECPFRKRSDAHLTGRLGGTCRRRQWIFCRPMAVFRIFPEAGRCLSCCRQT